MKKQKVKLLKVLAFPATAAFMMGIGTTAIMAEESHDTTAAETDTVLETDGEFTQDAAAAYQGKHAAADSISPDSAHADENGVIASRDEAAAVDAENTTVQAEDNTQTAQSHTDGSRSVNIEANQLENAKPRRVIVRPDTKLATYHFYDSDNQLLSSQTVKNGDILLKPEIPQDKKGKTFYGWYYKDVDGNYTELFEQFGNVSDITENGKTVDLYARYGDIVYVYFYDQYGYLIKSNQVQPNSTMTISKNAPMIQVKPLTQAQFGWSYKQNDDETGDISNNDFKVGTTSISLYPILKEGYWVSFETNGGTSVAKQFIKADAQGQDKKVTLPDPVPVKQGYMFDKWYKDADLTQAYDFTADVDAWWQLDANTLYAGYVPKTDTEYTVRYYIEDPNQDGAYHFIASEAKKGLTGANAEYTGGYIFASPYSKSQAGYELDSAKTEKAPSIKADGSTVYDVYYKCKAYSLSIVIPKADGTSETVSFGKVKYNKNLNDFWKQVFSIRPKKELFDGSHRFYYPLKPNGSSFVEDETKLNVMPDEDVALHYQGMVKTNSYENFYVEVLDGKAPDGREIVSNQSIRGKRKDTKQYYLYSSNSFSSGTYGGDEVSGDTIPGFTPYMEFSDGHYAIDSAGTVHIWFRYPKDQFYYNNPKSTYYVVQNEDGTQHMYSGSNDPINIYFIRNTYTLNFHTNGGPAVDSQNILYEKALHTFSPAVYIIKTTQKTEGNRKYVFAGWYADAEFTNEFHFGSTMPAYNVDLYAKWNPIQYTVKFDTGNGSSIEPIKEVEYGTAVSKPDDPIYDGRIFVGWTEDLETEKPYSFESPVTDNITLYAVWRSIGIYNVHYDLNGGTGTVPTDQTQYYENAAVTVASAGDVKAPAGKVFIGWKSSGDGKIYYNNGAAPMAYGGMTLTAQWGDVQETTQLTYDYNFDTYNITENKAVGQMINALKNNSRVTLADITQLTNAPKGYVFVGWNTKADGTGTMYQPGDSVIVDNVDSPNTLFAIWKKDKVNDVSNKESNKEVDTNNSHLLQTNVNTAKSTNTIGAHSTSQEASTVSSTPNTAYDDSSTMYSGLMTAGLAGVYLVLKKKFSEEK